MSEFLWKKPPSQLYISRSEIHVWKMHLNTIRKEKKSQLDIFSEEENKRLKSFKFEKDRFCYEITHGMKRLVLARYLNKSPEKLNFVLSNQGKPSISAEQNQLSLQFNISHAHQLVLLAVTVKDAVGIDIEYHDKNIDIEKLADFFFTFRKAILFNINQSKRKNKGFFSLLDSKGSLFKSGGNRLNRFAFQYIYGYE